MSKSKASHGEDKHRWSGEVTKSEHYHTPSGLFTERPEEIARRLKEDSTDERQAMARLTFYVNRAGHNLSEDDHIRLEHAKEELRKVYGLDADDY